MFSQTTYHVIENAGPAQPVLVLSNPSATEFTVRVRENERSATSEQTKYVSILLLISNNDLTGNDDYGPGDYTVTFPAGATIVPFNIPIVDDNILEGNEDFDIIIVPESLPDDVTHGNPGRATVNIIDNGGK